MIAWSQGEEKVLGRVRAAASAPVSLTPQLGPSEPHDRWMDGYCSFSTYSTVVTQLGMALLQESVTSAMPASLRCHTHAASRSCKRSRRTGLSPTNQHMMMAEPGT